MARKLYRVPVEKSVAKKVKASLRKKLASQGVFLEVRKQRVRRLFKGRISWDTVTNAYLVYSIGKEVGLWNTIREIFSSFGFTRDEIITLGLSKEIEKRKSAKKKKKKR